MQIYPQNNPYLTCAFGSAMPTRAWVDESRNYRYGFNGKETDEIFEGSVTFEERIFDSRIAKFFSLDPRMSDYSWQSPYAYFRNCPLSIIDFKGKGGVNDEEEPTEAPPQEDTDLKEPDVCDPDTWEIIINSSIPNGVIPSDIQTDLVNSTEFQNQMEDYIRSKIPKDPCCEFNERMDEVTNKITDNIRDQTPKKEENGNDLMVINIENGPQGVAVAPTQYNEIHHVEKVIGETPALVLGSTTEKGNSGAVINSPAGETDFTHSIRVDFEIKVPSPNATSYNVIKGTVYIKIIVNQ